MALRDVLLAAAGVAAAVALGGCGSAPSAGSPEPPTSLAGLCRALAAEPDQAEVHFAEAHQPLHQLAAETRPRDRAAAARLLEAKRAVEAALAQPPDARRGLDGELQTLIQAVRTSLQTLDRPAPACEADDATGQ